MIKKIKQLSKIKFRKKNLNNGRILSFEESIKSGPKYLPMVFLHVPKSAGISLASVLVTNYEFATSISSDDNEVSVPIDIFTGPYLYWGHISLSNELFRKISGPFHTITMLRHPVRRAVSNFAFTLRMKNAPWHEDVWNKEMDIVDLATAYTAQFGFQYSYYRDSGPPNSLAPEDCLSNFKRRISLFGFQEKFDELIVLFALVTGRRSLIYGGRSNVSLDLPKNQENIPAAKRDRLVEFPLEPTAEQERALTKLHENDIWFYDQATKIYEERMEVIYSLLDGQDKFRDIMNKYKEICLEYSDLVSKLPKGNMGNFSPLQE